METIPHSVALPPVSQTQEPLQNHSLGPSTKSTPLSPVPRAPRDLRATWQPASAQGIARQREQGMHPLSKLRSQSEVPTQDNLVLLLWYNLSSDQPGSPLIMAVTLLQDPGQRSCFSKTPRARNEARERGNALLLLAGAGWGCPLEEATTCVDVSFLPRTFHGTF